MTADPLVRDSQPAGVLAKIGSVLDKIFFSAKAKLVVLRLLLLSILVNLGVHLYTYTEAESHEGWYRSYTRGVYGYLVFTFIHHVLSVFVTPLIPRLLDFLLILVEIPLVVLTFIKYPYQYTALGATFIITVVGIFLNLFLLLIFRLAAIIRHGGKNLFKAFDIVEDRKREKVFPETRLPLALSLLFGRSIWRRQFLGEGVFVRLARGVLAWGLVLLLVIYCLMTVVIKPALESMFVPIAQTRSILQDFDSSSKRRFVPPWNDVFAAASWNIFVGVRSGPDDSTGNEMQADLGDRLIQATNISLIVKTNGGRQTLTCKEAANRDFLDLFELFIRFECPDIKGWWTRSEVVISVDFQRFQPNVTAENLDPIAIWPSLTNNSDNNHLLFKDLVPFNLYPGLRLLASVSIKGRKAFDKRNRAISALGLFESRNSYLMPIIQHVISDPLNASSLPGSENASSLRLLSGFHSNEFRVDIDTRDKSVLGGFAAIGGFFTFISGVFAVIFGTTFLRIFFGTKELSIFGIAQNWERDKIVEAYLKEYPQLEGDLDINKKHRGLAAVMQDQLLDVGLFAKSDLILGTKESELA